MLVVDDDVEGRERSLLDVEEEELRESCSPLLRGRRLKKEGMLKLSKGL